MTPEEYNAVLCYVKGNFAYFTTQELSKQWGDDWNDAPYECNAGPPYAPYRAASRLAGKDADGKYIWEEVTQHIDGVPDWQIVRVSFSGEFDLPCDGHYNSPYSVQDINGGAVPWLKDGVGCEIYAGTTLRKFIETVRGAGGTIYLPVRDGECAI